MLPPLLILLLACAPPTGSDTAGPEGEAASLVVSLRWVGGSPELDWPRARAGLWWALSSLGALPAADTDALHLLTAPGEGAAEVLFTLDLAGVGFPDHALPALAEVAAEMQQDPSVLRHGGVDVGRFLMRSLHEPWRYYAITGACDQMAGWQGLHLDADAQRYAVTDSMLVEGHRLVELNTAPTGAGGIAFRAAEVEGDLFLDGEAEVVVREFEVIDVMANGQQRFAVYGVDGGIRPHADPEVSPAGQPGRCMWCHEGALMIGQPNPTVPGYWSYERFFDEVSRQLTLLQEHRAGLDTAVDFTDYEVHGWAELLVEEFLSPSPARLAREWGISEEEAQDLGLERHISEEYPSMGELYRRGEVDALLLAREGWQPVQTLPSGREVGPDDVLAEAALRSCQSDDDGGR